MIMNLLNGFEKDSNNQCVINCLFNEYSYEWLHIEIQESSRCVTNILMRFQPTMKNAKGLPLKKRSAHWNKRGRVR